MRFGLLTKRIVLGLVGGVASTLLIVSGQNCSGNFTGVSMNGSKSSSNPPIPTLPDYIPETPQVTTGKALYTQHCSSCHGAYESSTKTGKSLEAINGAISVIAQMSHLKQLSVSDREAIAHSLNIGSNQTNGANPYACMPGNDPGNSDLRRLSRREYLATLSAITKGFVDLSSFQNEIDSLPADNVALVFDNTDSSISYNHIQSYFAVAKRVSSSLSTNSQWLSANLNCNYASEGMTAVCWNNYFSKFGTRVFRRPLTSTEQADYKALYQAQAGGSVAEGIRIVTMALLQSPDFLYKVEIGGKPVTGRNESELLEITDYELASRLAFAATGQGPDDELLADVAAGRLTNNESYRTIANRLFNSSLAKDHVRYFYAQWLGVIRLPASTHSDWFLGQIPRASIHPESIKEMEEFTDHFTWTAKGTYRDLMTSEMNFTRGRALATIYGVADTSSSNAGGASLFVEGEQMTASTGRAEDSGWNLYSNGTLTKSLSLASGKPYTVVLRAKASLINNIGAQFNVRFGSQTIATSTVSATQYQDHSFTFTPASANGNLVIEFTNDEYNQQTGADRNLYVDKITFATTEASAPTSNTAFRSGERPGVLSRTGFLLGPTNQASLVHRGLVVRRNLLCEKIAPPMFTDDEADLLKPPQPNPLESLRKQIETRTNSPRCLGCHAQINPMGFVLENYDSFGRYQTTQSVYDMNGNVLATHMVDARVNPNIDSPNDPPVNNLKEMSEAIASSTKGPACAAQQWFTYTKGREPSASDSCTLNYMFNTLMKQDQPSASGDTPATLLNMMKAPAFETNFRLRKIGPTQ